jgi:hypothetical protein
VDSRRLDRAPDSRTAQPVRVPARLTRVNLGAPANDNDAPLSARLVEAGRWVVLLAVLIGSVVFLVR